MFYYHFLFLKMTTTSRSVCIHSSRGPLCTNSFSILDRSVDRHNPRSLIKRFPAKKPARTFEQVYGSLLIGTVFICITAMGLGAKTYDTVIIRGFLQLFCLLGYSLAPFVFASLFLWLSGAVEGETINWILAIISVVWSLIIMAVFLSTLIDRKRLVLAMYPVLLLNAYIAYIIIL